MSVPSDFDRICLEVRESSIKQLQEHAQKDLPFAQNMISLFGQQTQEWKAAHLDLIEKAIAVAPEGSDYAPLITFIMTLGDEDKRACLDHALRNSVIAGNQDLVEALLVKGANPNYVDDGGLNVFSHAIKSESDGILELLLEESDQLPSSSKDQNGDSFYHLIFTYPNRKNVLKIFNEKKWPFDFSPNNEGTSPFELLIKNDNVQFALLRAEDVFKQYDQGDELRDLFQEKPVLVEKIARYLKKRPTFKGDYYVFFFTVLPDSLFKNQEIQEFLHVFFKHPKYFDEALGNSCEYGAREFANALINMGATLNLEENLYSAIENGYQELALDLIRHGMAHDIWVEGKELLNFAVLKKMPKVVAEIIKSKNINIKGFDGANALFEAVDLGEVESVKILLNAGANPNHISEKDEYALHKAINNLIRIKKEFPDDNESLEVTIQIIKLLVKSGADCNQLDVSGINPFHQIWTVENQDLAIDLIPYIKNINQYDRHGATPLINACDKGLTNLALALLDRKDIDVDLQSEPRKSTALHSAVALWNKKIITKLIEKKANLYIRNVYGGIPIFYAGNKDILQQLLDADPKLIFSMNNSGQLLNEMLSENLEEQITEQDLIKMLKPEALEEIKIYQFLSSESPGIEYLKDELFKKTKSDRKDIIDNIKKLIGEYQSFEYAMAIVQGAVNYDDFDYAEIAFELSDFNIPDEDGVVPLHAILKNPTFTRSQGVTHKIINYFITNRIGINAVNNDGETALIIAAKRGLIGITNQLIAQGVNLNCKNKSGKTALDYAVERDELENVDVLIKAGAYLNTRDNENGTLLIKSIKAGYYKTAMRLLEEEIDLNKSNGDQKSPLMHALECAWSTDVSSQNYHRLHQIIIALIKRSNLNLQDKNGFTALFYASSLHSDIALALIEKGIDLQIKEKDREIALFQTRNKEVIEAMIKKDPELLRFFNKSNQSAIDYLFNDIYKVTAEQEKMQILEKLLPNFHPLSRHYCLVKMGIPVNEYMRIAEETPEDQKRIIKELKTWSPKRSPQLFVVLNHAVTGKHWDLVNAIIDVYDIIRANFTENHTLLQGLFPSGGSLASYVTLAGILIDKGADVNKIDSNGETVLHAAVRAGEASIIRKLIENGADLNIASKHGETPLQIALKLHNTRLDFPSLNRSEEYDKEIVPLLLKAGADPILLYEDQHLISILYGIQDLNIPWMENEFLKTVLTKNPAEQYLFFAGLSEKDQKVQLDFLKKQFPKSYDEIVHELLRRAVLQKEENFQISMISLLLEKGASPNKVNAVNRIPILFHAIRFNRFELIKLLVKHGANVNQKDGEGRTPLYKMFSKNLLDKRSEWIKTFEYLIENGANVSIQASGKKNLLETAVAYKELEIARLIASKAPSLSIWKELKNYNQNNVVKTIADEMGIPKFVIHSYCDEKDLVQQAFLDLSLEERKQAIKQFSGSDYEDVLYKILDSSIKFDGGLEDNALFLALLDSGLNVNRNTPLIKFCANKNIKMVEELLVRGADVNLTSPFGSPLYQAVKVRNQTLIKKLLDYGANIFQRIEVANEVLLHPALYFANDQLLHQIFLPLLSRGVNRDIEMALVQGKDDEAANLLSLKSIEERELILSQLKLAYPDCAEIDDFMINYRNQIDLKHYATGLEEEIPEPSRPCRVEEMFELLDWIDFKDKQSPFYRDPSQLRVMGKTITVSQLQQLLKQLINNINNRTKVVATGESEQELEDFYGKLEKLIQNIIIICSSEKTPENADKAFAFLLDFAEAGTKCGAAHIDTAKEHLDLLSEKPAATDFKTSVEKILAKERRVALDNRVLVSTRHPDPSNIASEKHERHQFLQKIGESRGIPGIRYTGDPYVYHLVFSKEIAEKAFDHVYSPSYIARRVYEAIENREIPRDVIAYTLQELMPDDWFPSDWEEVQALIYGYRDDKEALREALLDYNIVWEEGKTLEDVINVYRKQAYVLSFYETEEDEEIEAKEIEVPEDWVPTDGAGNVTDNWQKIIAIRDTPTLTPEKKVRNLAIHGVQCTSANINKQIEARRKLLYGLSLEEGKERVEFKERPFKFQRVPEILRKFGVLHSR